MKGVIQKAHYMKYINTQYFFTKIKLVSSLSLQLPAVRGECVQGEPGQVPVCGLHGYLPLPHQDRGPAVWRPAGPEDAGGHQLGECSNGLLFFGKLLLWDMAWWLHSDSYRPGYSALELVNAGSPTESPLFLRMHTPTITPPVWAKSMTQQLFSHSHWVSIIIE